MKVLVIGGVAAGTKAAAKLKREDRGLDVALITKDQDISYAGCGLPYYVGGMIESRDELIVNTPEKYAALTGVRVLTGREAVELDSGKKLVTAGSLKFTVLEITEMDFLDQYIPLNSLPIGETGIVQKLLSTGTQRRRMLDLGLVNGTPVEALQKSPSGDPTAYFIRGAVIALRSEDAGKILVER